MKTTIYYFSATDFSRKFSKLEVPVYFFSGKYDLTVNINLSKAYFEKVDAPVKRFYTFDYSAHSPIFEESERVGEIIENDVLNVGNGATQK